MESPMIQQYFNVLELNNSWETTTLQKLAVFNHLSLRLQKDDSDTKVLSYGRFTTNNFERVVKTLLGTGNFGFAVGCMNPKHKHLACKNFKAKDVATLESLFPIDTNWYCIISVYDPNIDLGLMIRELAKVSF